MKDPTGSRFARGTGPRRVLILALVLRLLGKVTRMGFDRSALIDAVTAGGFNVLSSDEWPGWDHYVAVFEKPAAGQRIEK